MIALKKSRAASTDRRPAPAPVAQAQSRSLPAPLRGWVEGSALGLSDGLWASENVFPTNRGVRLRGGCYKSATIGSPVTSMFAYRAAGSEKLFAASATDIYDVSALDPVTAPVADITGQTGGLYSTAQLGTVGAQFLLAVNGSDEAQLYDGSAWTQINGSSSPAITGVPTENLKYVWTHKNRFWFIEKATSTAWYLPVDTAGGAAADFSLAGVFQDGGALLFGATWSQDSGSGMDDRMVFVSDRGEVAIYAGTNPASAADWALVGLYKMGNPLGPHAHIKAGGDLLIGTDVGLVSLSAIMQKDPAALEASAVSAAIEPTWKELSRGYVATAPWQIMKWPRESMAFVAAPSASGRSLVANINSGSWSQYTGWDVQCMALFNGLMYFGSADGFLYQAERGGSDDGTSYTCRWAYSPQDLGSGASHKAASAMRATFAASTPFNPQLSLGVDYQVSFPAPPQSALDDAAPTSTWDHGLWDTAIWDESLLNSAEAPIALTGWVAQGAKGTTIIPQFQVTVDGANRPNVEFLSSEVLFEVGGVLG